MLKEKIHFIKKSFTLKRFTNAVKSYIGYKLSILLKKPVVWGLPMICSIEPTDICNLKCPLCPSGNGTLKRAKGYLALDTFKKAIDEIYKKTFMLILWNQGEPFLNKDFNKMVKYASSKGLYTYCSSNLNIMPDADEIVKSGLDTLIVSLDGASQDVYNKYRVNGDLNKVLENVKKITDAKKRLKSITPIIKWQFIVMKHNEHQLSEIKQLAKKVGVDSLELKTVQIYSKDDINTFLPTNPKYRRYKVKGNDFELKFGIKNRCRRLWGQPVINWSGEVSICCFDKDIDFKVGNINNQSFESIWKGTKFNKIRKTILTNRGSIEMCRNCGEGVSLKIEEKKV